MKQQKGKPVCLSADKDQDPRRKLTVEELEKRVAPGIGDKKVPIPPPYPPGADYGLARRDNLAW